MLVPALLSLLALADGPDPAATRGPLVAVEVHGPNEHLAGILAQQALAAAEAAAERVRAWLGASPAEETGSPATIHVYLRPGRFRGLFRLMVNHRGCHMAGSLYEEHAALTELGHMGHVREYAAREISDFLDHVGLSTQEVIWRFPDPLPAGLWVVVGWLERAMCLVAPSMRPHFSLVCVKPGEA